jgi:hypothetical protein
MIDVVLEFLSMTERAMPVPCGQVSGGRRTARQFPHQLVIREQHERRRQSSAQNARSIGYGAPRGASLRGQHFSHIQKFHLAVVLKRVADLLGDRFSADAMRHGSAQWFGRWSCPRQPALGRSVSLTKRRAGHRPVSMREQPLPEIFGDVDRRGVKADVAGSSRRVRSINVITDALVRNSATSSRDSPRPPAAFEQFLLISLSSLIFMLLSTSRKHGLKG